MTRQKTIKKENVDQGKRAFLRGSTALLGAAVLAKLTGCGDTHITNNYYGRDGGAADKRVPDKGTPDKGKLLDVLSPDACVPIVKPAQCNDTTTITNVINQGKTLDIGGGYALKLDDCEVYGNTISVVLSVIDSCGNVIMPFKGEKEQTLYLTISNMKVEVTVHDLAAGYTFGAKWAKVSVKTPCYNWCLSQYGTVNQGESLKLDGLKFQLDDLGTTPYVSTGKAYALITILDAFGNAMQKLKIYEGMSKEVAFGTGSYRIDVPVVAPGYTFGAKWVQMKVFKQKHSACYPTSDAGLGKEDKGLKGDSSTTPTTPASDGGI